MINERNLLPVCSFTTSVKESYSHPYDQVTEEPCSDPRTSYRCPRHRSLPVWAHFLFLAKSVWLGVGRSFLSDCVLTAGSPTRRPTGRQWRQTTAGGTSAARDTMKAETSVSVSNCGNLGWNELHWVFKKNWCLDDQKFSSMWPDQCIFKNKGTIKVHEYEVGSGRSRKQHAVTEWLQRVRKLFTLAGKQINDRKLHRWWETKGRTEIAAGADCDGFWDNSRLFSCTFNKLCCFCNMYQMPSLQSWKIEYGYTPQNIHKNKHAIIDLRPLLIKAFCAE